MMRNEEDLEALRTSGRHHLAQVIEQLHFLGDRLGARPQLAAVAEEVVVGVHQQDGGVGGIVAHKNSFPSGALCVLVPLLE
jgi:hypothetical protein